MQTNSVRGHSQGTTVDGADKQGAVSGEIDIAFGVDVPFVPHMAAVIASLLRTAPGARFRFIILHDGVSAERRASIERIAPSHRFCWIEIHDSNLPPFLQRDHYTRAILFRLGLDDLAPPDCHRVIYLDSDVIVLRDIRELWNADLNSCALGAVDDTFTTPKQFAARWNLPHQDQRYFNSGVLLIDLDRVRKEGTFRKAMQFVADNDRSVQFSDQDALNWAQWGKWQPLPYQWNAQRMNVISSLTANMPPDQRFDEHLPGIVHFVGPEKPWVLTGYHPWSWVYWSNLASTPFYREVAESAGLGPLEKARLWLRWQRRRPRR